MVLPDFGSRQYTATWRSSPEAACWVTPRLDQDAEAERRLAEVDEICSALRASPASVQASKSRTVADTAQIDLFDGKLYARMRDLNAAARSAIRNGHLQAGLHEYSFHRLKRSGNPNPVTPSAPAPDVKPAPTA